MMKDLTEKMLDVLLEEKEDPRTSSGKGKFKLRKTSTSITFPFVLAFNDYHDIYILEEQLNDLTSARIRSDELEVRSSEGSWVGLFYVGRRPGKSEVAELLREAGIGLETDEDEEE